MTKRSFRPAARKPAPPPGLASRRRACELIEAVLLRARPLDEALDEPTDLDAADRALAPFGARADVLRAAARFVAERKN